MTDISMIVHILDFGTVSIPDCAFKMSKKTDPFKSFISQPLWDVNFLGPECCEMKDLNGPNFKKFHDHYECYD
jgi:hypothetical protein